MKSHAKVRITTSGTTTVIAESVALTQAWIAVVTPGTGWVLKIQDKATPTPFEVVAAIPLSAPSSPDWKYQHFDEPLYMQGGIDVITSGTAGVITVWFNFEKGGG